jgi:hypothetical protein
MRWMRLLANFVAVCAALLPRACRRRTREARCMNKENAFGQVHEKKMFH